MNKKERESCDGKKKGGRWGNNAETLKKKSLIVRKSGKTSNGKRRTWNEGKKRQ